MAACFGYVCGRGTGRPFLARHHRYFSLFVCGRFIHHVLRDLLSSYLSEAELSLRAVRSASLSHASQVASTDGSSLSHSKAFRQCPQNQQPFHPHLYHHPIRPRIGTDQASTPLQDAGFATPRKQRRRKRSKLQLRLPLRSLPHPSPSLNGSLLH